MIVNNNNMDTSTTNTNQPELEDINRALYDLGAQDLLDVWEAMDSEVKAFIFHALAFIHLFLRSFRRKSERNSIHVCALTVI